MRRGPSAQRQAMWLLGGEAPKDNACVSLKWGQRGGAGRGVRVQAVQGVRPLLSTFKRKHTHKTTAVHTLNDHRGATATARRTVQMLIAPAERCPTRERDHAEGVNSQSSHDSDTETGNAF